MAGAIQELADLFARLPGIGKRTATRLVFHLISSNSDYAQALGENIASFHGKIKYCAICSNISDTDPCDICNDPLRNEKIICVVESVPDLWALENSGTYRGHYHVLHGLLSPLDGIGPDDLNIDRLLKSVKEKNVHEIIVATRPSVEGEATALLIKQMIANKDIKTTRIASGIPLGSELEYTDSRTLERALDDRKAI